MKEFFNELKARLREPTTWAGMVTAIAGGAGLEQPWATIATIAGLIGVLMPPVTQKAA